MIVKCASSLFLTIFEQHAWENVVLYLSTMMEYTSLSDGIEHFKKLSACEEKESAREIKMHKNN